jgi:hypothetical protein
VPIVIGYGLGVASSRVSVEPDEVSATELVICGTAFCDINIGKGRLQAKGELAGVLRYIIGSSAQALVFFLWLETLRKFIIPRVVWVRIQNCGATSLLIISAVLIQGGSSFGSICVGSFATNIASLAPELFLPAPFFKGLIAIEDRVKARLEAIGQCLNFIFCIFVYGTHRVWRTFGYMKFTFQSKKHWI